MEMPSGMSGIHVSPDEFGIWRMAPGAGIQQTVDAALRGYRLRMDVAMIRSHADAIRQRCARVRWYRESEKL